MIKYGLVIHAIYQTCNASVFQGGSLGGVCVNDGCQLSLSGVFGEPVTSSASSITSVAAATSSTTTMQAIGTSTPGSSIERGTVANSLASITRHLLVSVS